MLKLCNHCLQTAVPSGGSEPQHIDHGLEWNAYPLHKQPIAVTLNSDLNYSSSFGSVSIHTVVYQPLVVESGVGGENRKIISSTKTEMYIPRPQYNHLYHNTFTKTSVMQRNTDDTSYKSTFKVWSYPGIISRRPAHEFV
jgi:hypothetical protein